VPAWPLATARLALARGPRTRHQFISSLRSTCGRFRRALGVRLRPPGRREPPRRPSYSVKARRRAPAGQRARARLLMRPASQPRSWPGTSPGFPPLRRTRQAYSSRLNVTLVRADRMAVTAHLPPLSCHPYTQPGVRDRVSSAGRVSAGHRQPSSPADVRDRPSWGCNHVHECAPRGQRLGMNHPTVFWAALYYLAKLLTFTDILADLAGRRG